MVSYHVCLLQEAGLIHAIDFLSNDGTCWRPTRLTFAGHEFLDSVRDPKVWDYAKGVADKAGSHALDFIFEAAKAFARHELKRLTDLDI